jgi:hypothetical protein
MKFENKISIDGVAVIVAVVGASLWLGNIQAKVNQLGKDSDEAKVQVSKLSDNQVTLATSLVLVAMQVHDLKSQQDSTQK